MRIIFLPQQPHSFSRIYHPVDHHFHAWHRRTYHHNKIITSSRKSAITHNHHCKQYNVCNSFKQKVLRILAIDFMVKITLMKSRKNHVCPKPVSCHPLPVAKPHQLPWLCTTDQYCWRSYLLPGAHYSNQLQVLSAALRKVELVDSLDSKLDYGIFGFQLNICHISYNRALIDKK